MKDLERMSFDEMAGYVNTRQPEVVLQDISRTVFQILPRYIDVTPRSLSSFVPLRDNCIYFLNNLLIAFS
jgi:hypothetical protein